MRELTGIELGALTFQLEDLLGVRPVHIAFQILAHGDSAMLQAAMPFLQRVGRAKVLGRRTEAFDTRLRGKEGLDVGEQMRLVVFDREKE